MTKTLNLASKKSHRGLGRAAFVLGIIALAAAFVLVLINAVFAGRSATQSQEILQALEQQMPYERTSYTEMGSGQTLATAQVNGVSYAGIIELDGGRVALPVAAQWSNALSSVCPGIYAGSPYDGDLVIGGANLRSQFGNLSKIPDGTEVAFCDMSGREFHYVVASAETIASAEMQQLIEYSATWQLTLFADSFSGRQQILLRCTAVTE